MLRLVAVALCAIKLEDHSAEPARLRLLPPLIRLFGDAFEGFAVALYVHELALHRAAGRSLRLMYSPIFRSLLWVGGGQFLPLIIRNTPTSDDSGKPILALDPSWLTFGLEMPSTNNAPGQPHDVTVTLDETGTLLLRCSPVALAMRYRWRMLMPA